MDLFSQHLFLLVIKPHKCTINIIDHSFQVKLPSKHQNPETEAEQWYLTAMNCIIYNCASLTLICQNVFL